MSACKKTSALRLGLCCVFLDHPIKFRRTTVTYAAKLSKNDRLTYISTIARHNAENLLKALQTCHELGIGSFRINSQILPVKTHPEVGYHIQELPEHKYIIDTFCACGEYSRTNNIRTTFHPDQFVVLSSPNRDVVKKSILELEYQAEVASWVNADVLNIHGGGVYGDKPAALARFADSFNNVSKEVQSRLTLENDDVSYTPSDLLPLCKKLGIPLVYDVHHHRCCKDELSIEEATKEALSTWNREPLFHISSPKDGWNASNPKKHHDYIAVTDFPECWLPLQITVEVEAKAKERAVKRLETNLLKSGHYVCS